MLVESFVEDEELARTALVCHLAMDLQKPRGNLMPKRYHAAQNDYSYISQIKSKTIGL